MERLLICRGPGHNPYENLALEELLLDRAEPGVCILYLWQNQHTVVIGRNQNPWKECRVALLEQEAGRLARRLSGGGAVYHDLGNLNFTFLLAKEDDNLDRQLGVLEAACQRMGVPVTRSGRNDLLAEGRKFSGNAFYSHAGKAYHHGTLMVEVDLERVERYLSPSKAKLAAKGVDSVRSRVVNLRDLRAGVTVEDLAGALEDSFQQVYGGKARLLELSTPERERLRARTAHYAGEDWRYGRSLPFTLCCQGRFPWGGVELRLQADRGSVQGVQVFTDAMDADLAGCLERALTGVSLRPQGLTAALEGTPLPRDCRQDLLELLLELL